jgi:chromosomal replication initiation ATPase DnaA
MKAITPEQIMQCVAEACEIEVADLKTVTNSHRISYPRHICIYLIRKYCYLKMAAIGRMFNYKDHTVVLYVQEKLDRLEPHHHPTLYRQFTLSRERVEGIVYNQQKATSWEKN